MEDSTAWVKALNVPGGDAERRWTRFCLTLPKRLRAAVRNVIWPSSYSRVSTVDCANALTTIITLVLSPTPAESAILDIATFSARVATCSRSFLAGGRPYWNRAVTAEPEPKGSTCTRRTRQARPLRVSETQPRSTTLCSSSTSPSGRTTELRRLKVFWTSEVVSPPTGELRACASDSQSRRPYTSFSLGSDVKLKLAWMMSHA
mmetsp:Transcript_26130/g.60340  ORF Transcript_26130/g.60340 Transcript_26130/m.60340 type:complete len:204 (+) Transcript_26130:4076-4687(+)